MTRYTRKYRVTIGDKSTTVHVENEEQAIERAVEKLYGSRCFWFPDSGLRGYGQVFESLRPTKNNSQPGNTSRTYKVALEVEALGKPSKNFLKQQADDAAEDKRVSELIRIEDSRRSAAYNAGFFGEQFPQELRGGADESLLMREYHNGSLSQSEAAAQQEYEQGLVDREEAAAEQREHDEYMAEQQAIAAAENDERISRAKRVSGQVRYYRSLPFEELLRESTIISIIKNTIAPAEWTRQWKGKISLGDFKKEMINGLHREAVMEFIQSEKLYKKIENIE